MEIIIGVDKNGVGIQDGDVCECTFGPASGKRGKARRYTGGLVAVEIGNGEYKVSNPHDVVVVEQPARMLIQA